MKKWFQSLQTAYKLLLIREDSLEESFRMRYKPLYAFLAGAGLFLILVSCLVWVIYADSKNTITIKDKNGKTQKIDAYDQGAMVKRFKDLEEKLQANDLYIKNLQKALNPNVTRQKDTAKQELSAIPNDTEAIDLSASKKDSIFRKQVEAERKNPSIKRGKAANQGKEIGLLFPPLKGIKTGAFDPANRHYAIDIAAKVGESIKAVESGYVLFSDWTAETGYVVIIYHKNGLQSIYKHNSIVYKNVGDFVKKGEVISAVGNTGELTTGPHLHLELWLNGQAVNPEDYIQF